MKKIITAISFAMMLAGVTAYADTTVDQCTYDRDTGVAVVSGTADSDEVTVSVKDGENVFYEGQQTVQNGSYQFDFQLQGAARTDYSVMVGGSEAAPVTDSLIYYGDEVDEIFAKLNEYANAQNSSAFQELLTNSLDVLGLKLSEEEQSAIPYMASALMTQAPFNKVSDMKTAFETAKYLYDLSTISDSKVLNGIIKTNKDRYTAKYPNIYDVYSNSDEAKQEAICAAIITVVDKKVVTEDRFNEIFAVQTMRNAIKSAAGWSAARDLISKTQSEIRITASSLSNKSDVYIKMINSDYNEIGDFNSAYAKALQEVESSQNSRPSGGGTGGGSTGGGGSSSSGSQITFVPETPVQDTTTVGFKDISRIAWAKEAIEGLAKENIINGRDDDTFDPDAPVLREEFIKMLVLTFNMNLHKSDSHFGDVDDNAWYAEYVDTAKDADLVSGMDDNTFGVGRNITRQDMVTITYRAMQKYHLTEEQDAETEAFTDDESIADYARDGIYYLRNAKIVNGRDGDKFDPQANLSRAEAAKILYSVRNLKIAKDYVAEENVE